MAQRIEVIARGLLTRGSSILLCRNDEHGYEYLPGGHVEFGESAPEACRREFLEETGLEIRVLGCELVAEVRFRQGGEGGKQRHELNLVFHVEHAGPSDALEQVESREPGISFRWAERAALVETDLRPSVIRAWIVSGCGADDTDRPSWLTSPE